MPRKAEGTIFTSDGSIYASVTIAPRKRVARALTWLKVDDELSAKAWSTLLQDLVHALNGAGRSGEVLAKLDLAIQVGREDPAQGFERVRAGVAKLRAGRAAEQIAGPSAAAPSTGKTFAQVAKMWTDGEIARLFPDHISTKKTVDQDVARLKILNTEIGHVPIASFTIDDALRAMGKVPKRFKAANRRQYAQVIRRVLQVAVFPLRLRPDNPIPRGFLPRVRDEHENKWLYPDEEAQLVRCADVPLVYRLAYGFLARMGFRKSEIIGGEDDDPEDKTAETIPALTWERLDLVRGVVRTARTKTSDVGRPIRLDEGVWRALEAWREMHRDAPDDAPVFADAATGEPINLTTKLLRAHLRAAKIDRAELFDKPEIRVHDLRATFVTVKLALGWTDHQVRDRTGHTTVTMLDRYRRDARTLQEIEIADFVDLDAALFPRRTEAPQHGGAAASKRPATRFPSAMRKGSARQSARTAASAGSGAGIRTPIRGSKSRAVLAVRPKKQAARARVYHGCTKRRGCTSCRRRSDARRGRARTKAAGGPSLARV